MIRSDPGSFARKIGLRHLELIHESAVESEPEDSWGQRPVRLALGPHPQDALRGQRDRFRIEDSAIEAASIAIAESMGASSGSPSFRGAGPTVRIIHAVWDCLLSDGYRFPAAYDGHQVFVRGFPSEDSGRQFETHRKPATTGEEGGVQPLGRQ